VFCANDAGKATRAAKNRSNRVLVGFMMVTVLGLVHNPRHHSFTTLSE